MESGTSPSALQPRMHNPPQVDTAEPSKDPLQLGTDLALGTGKLCPFPKWTAWQKGQIVGWAELGSSLIPLRAPSVGPWMGPASCALCFTFPLRTAALSHFSRELYLNALTERTPQCHGDGLTPPQPAVGHTSHEGFPPFALQQHSNAITDASDVCWGPRGSRGVGRAEPSQSTGPPWCFCTSTSPRNWELHLGKDAYKMTAQVQIIFIFPCVQNAYQFLCVVFLLPVMETHPASASKQQRKLQRQQTLTKSCPKASPHIHFPLHHLFCKCNKLN